MPFAPRLFIDLDLRGSRDATRSHSRIGKAVAKKQAPAVLDLVESGAPSRAPKRLVVENRGHSLQLLAIAARKSRSRPRAETSRGRSVESIEAPLDSDGERNRTEADDRKIAAGLIEVTPKRTVERCRCE